jgi:hypothetical protein
VFDRRLATSVENLDGNSGSDTPLGRYNDCDLSRANRSNGLYGVTHLRSIIDWIEFLA